MPGSARQFALLLLYPFWLLAVLLFGAGVLLIEALLPNRSAHHGRRYGFELPGKSGVMALDAVSAALAYWVGDVLRCTLERGTTWPERVGVAERSTLGMHAIMLAFVMVAWPVILHWLGWYQPRWRSTWWKARNTLFALVLVCMAMAGAALLYERNLYPRWQFAYFLAVLPVATAVVGGVWGLLRRLAGHRPAPPQQLPDPDW